MEEVIRREWESEYGIVDAPTVMSRSVKYLGTFRRAPSRGVASQRLAETSTGLVPGEPPRHVWSMSAHMVLPGLFSAWNSGVYSVNCSCTALSMGVHGCHYGVVGRRRPASKPITVRHQTRLTLTLDVNGQLPY